MSHVNDGLIVYFQTGEHYLKTQQIRQNPNVALSVGTYEIEGIATIIGHPMDEANSLITEKIKTKHPNAFKRWSALPNQVLVKVEIGLVRQWKYVDGKPFIAIGEFAKQCKKPCAKANSFDIAGFIQAVAKQKADALRAYFTSDAIICWYDSNEQFTVDEYIRANCEYPGDWNGELQHIRKFEDGMVIVTKIFSDESTHFVTAFAKLTEGKICRLDEYYSDCGEAPEWRKNMNIGKPIL